MEIDIVASFPGEGPVFPNLEGLFKVESWSDPSGVSLALVGGVSASDVDQAIVGFVKALQSALGDVPSGGELRVAVYYAPEEVAAFMVTLSAGAVRLLADTGLAIEVTGFPCSS